MVAAVAVETRQRAKRTKATAKEELKTPPPPPPPPPAAARRHRQPTPDHPPYCWMIGEAIDALGEGGGSAEDTISAFIRATHPGVPAAHDRLLRHYLAKHVAEGFFVCTASGRYARSLDDAAAAEAAVEPAAAVRVGSPVAKAKRGRGRPRKDGSSPTSPAGEKGGGAGSGPRSATPKRRGRRRGAAPLAAGEGSVPTSSVAAADRKDGNQATDSTPRRRRRLRKLATSTDVSGEAPATDKEDGVDAPSPTDKEHGRSLELALVVVGDGSATTPTMDNACGEAPPTTPVDCGEPRELARVTAAHLPALMPPTDKDSGDDQSFNLALVVKHDGITATSTVAPERSTCELPLVAAADGPVPVLLADKEEGGETPSATKKGLCQPRKAEPVMIASQGSAPTSTAGKKARGKDLSATPKAKGRRGQHKPALVATGGHSAPASVAGKKAGRKVSFATPKLTPVADGNQAPSIAPKPNDRPGMVYPLTAEEIPDDPAFCLLALPAQIPAAANA